MRVSLQLSVDGRPMLIKPVARGLTTIGQNPECDLVVPHEGVAPVQCILRLVDHVVTLMNRAAAGTRVGDTCVQDELRLADGDVLRVGLADARLRFEPDVASSGATRTLESLEPNADYVVSVPEQSGDRTWRLTASGLSFGTDAANDVVLDDDYVSAFHARLSVEAGRCMVRDLDSRNGVFIGSRKIREAEVVAGEQLRVGKTLVMVVPESVAGEDPRDADAVPWVAQSDCMRELRDLIRRLAQNDAPVLISGETGTGKEVAATLLARLSARARAPWIVINCGTLGRDLVASELFGHEKGAFTGATQRKAGAFEAADGGTLFLDEIGELPLELQPQLLRALETGEVRRVGSAETFRVDVRVVAATNRKLQRQVEIGAFREDLFHRLHVLALEMPPLRQRRKDIKVLAHYFLTQFAPRGQLLQFSEAAMARLRGHDWPGNVRELRNVVQRAVLMRRGEVMGVEEVTFTPSTLVTRVETTQAVSTGKTLGELERDAIVQALTRASGSRTDAAVALGVSRSTVHRKIREHGIDLDALLAARGAT